MNYVSGLMLGASIANMLRQTLGGSGSGASVLPGAAHPHAGSLHAAECAYV